MLSFGQLNGKKMNAKNPSGKLDDLRVGLTFDDVLLVPKYSGINPERTL